MWVLNDQGLIVFANPAAVAALGYDHPSDLYHRHSHDTVHRLPDGSPYPRGHCPMQEPFRSGDPAHGADEWFERRDGSLFPVDWWVAPIALSSGRGAVLAFTDVSERRAAEQAVRERDAAAIREAESRAAQRRIVEASAVVRRQVARDLHDGAQQSLVSVLISTQLAREEVARDPARAGELLDEAVAHARVAINDLREIASGLHPPILTHGGLVTAVEDSRDARLAAGHRRRVAPAATARSGGEQRLLLRRRGPDQRGEARRRHVGERVDPAPRRRALRGGPRRRRRWRQGRGEGAVCRVSWTGSAPWAAAWSCARPPIPG